jgi:preprotein translocase subunit YajC
MLFTTDVYAAGTQATGQAATTGQQSGIGSTIFLIIVWLVIIYFLIIMPQRKRNKAHNDMLNTLEEGDEVITSGGIKGEIISFDGEFVELRVDKGVKLTIKKSYIQSLHKKKATI